MSETHPIIRYDGPDAWPHTSASAAKLRLLVWAADNDARRRAAGSSLQSIAKRGALAVVGGMVMARILAPRRMSASGTRRRGMSEFLIGAAVLGRAAMLLAPHVMCAVKDTTKPPGSQ